LSEKVTAKFS